MQKEKFMFWQYVLHYVNLIQLYIDFSDQFFACQILFIKFYLGCPQKRVPKLNGYNFLNIYGSWMKQKLAESKDFKVLLHLSIYFSNIFLLATIPAEIVQRVIGEFSRRIRNYIVAVGRLFEK